MKNVIAIAILFLLAGCTTVGPFVTDLQQDQDNGRLVAKVCYLRFVEAPFYHRIGLDRCVTETVGPSSLVPSSKRYWHPTNR